MHLHSLLLLSQPSRLPVTVTKPRRIYISVTFHVQQHQTSNSHYNPSANENRKKAVPQENIHKRKVLFIYI